MFSISGIQQSWDKKQEGGLSFTRIKLYFSSMKRLKQYESLVIHDYEEAVFHLPGHTHTFYEMVYIVKGQGIYSVNQYEMPYSAGDFFIVAPGDVHYFDIGQSTHFVFIKFTESYLPSFRYLMPDAYGDGSPESILWLRYFRESAIRWEEPYQTILRNTVESIRAYNAHKTVFTSTAVFHLILCILSLLRENMPQQAVLRQAGHTDLQEVIQYIHQNIYTPDKLKIPVIAAHFFVAPSYFGNFFRRSFNLSYREYLNNLRVTLLRKRIVSGHKSMKEIAVEFGFTDESHFSHFIKNKMNTTAQKLKAGGRQYLPAFPED